MSNLWKCGGCSHDQASCRVQCTAKPDLCLHAEDRIAIWEKAIFVSEKEFEKLKEGCSTCKMKEKKIELRNEIKKLKKENRNLKETIKSEPLLSTLRDLLGMLMDKK